MIQFKKIFSKNNFTLILILFLGCLLLSGVNAAEMDNDNITVDSNSILIEDSNDVIAQNNHSFDDLSDLINKTPKNETLILDSDYTFINGSNTGILISKSITIDGAGHTLNATKLSRIFNVTADNVVLKNINFINGNALGSYGKYFGGGAIYWSGTDGLLENCNFTDNSATGIEDDPYDENLRPMGRTINQGGAITWSGENGTISNCSFKHNHVAYPDNGGAIFWQGDNGKIINSQFYENSAYRGSAIYWEGVNGTIALSTFNNSGICDSGIFWTGKNGVVKNSILLKSSGNQDVISPYSVKVKVDFNFWGDTVDNPNSVNKSEDVQYWILYGYGADRDFVFEGDNFTVYYNFTSVMAKSGQKYYYTGMDSKAGSLILISNKTGLLNLTFKNNEFVVDAIPYNSTGDFYDLLVKIHNTPEGGLLFLDRDYEYVNGSNKGILISKPITIDGAGHTLNGKELSRIFNITADNVTIKNVSFINGNALGQYYSKNIGGGAIYWSGANGFIENCNFTNNAGRGIENDPFNRMEVVIMDDGLIYYRGFMRPMGAKTNEGGAIVWNGNNGAVSKCVFINNAVGYPNTGGAICWRGDFGKVIDSEFYENDAWCGSAIAWMGNNGTILSSTVANSSFFDGGIYWFGENGLIRDSILLGNGNKAALAPSGADVDADYNFWGDTLEHPNQEAKIGTVTKWLVMNFTHNGELVHKGQKIVIDYDIINLIDKNGKLSIYGALINKSGQFTYTAAKDGYLVITFGNGKINVNIDSKDRIKSKDLTRYYTTKTVYKVTVKDLNGKVTGKYVKFSIKGKKAIYVKTDRNGVATLKVSLKPGKYYVTISYGDAKVKNKILVKTTLITKNVSKKVKKPAKFKVKVLNSKGKAYANKLVKIKFKGKLYKIKTNKNGLVFFKLPDNLKVGKYTIKTACNGLKNKNKIIVKK